MELDLTILVRWRVTPFLADSEQQDTNGRIGSSNGDDDGMLVTCGGPERCLGQRPGSLAVL